MRPLKFRAWDKKLKEWVSPDAVSITLSGVPMAPYETWMKHNLADLVVTQFTGLHDRHGKEVWEGDKVRFLRKQGYWSHDKGDVEVVKYITDPQAQYCGFGFSALHPLTSRKAKKIEVIGNIFTEDK